MDTSEIPLWAWDPAIPAVPGMVVAPGQVGFEIHRQWPIGGHSLLDMFACAVLQGLYSNPSLHPFDHEETMAEHAWRVAAALCRTRPKRPEIPAAEQDKANRPRLALPEGM